MSLQRSLLLSAIAVVLGVITFQLTMATASDPASQKNLEACISGGAPEILEIPALDGFLCIIIPFFQQSVATPESTLVTNLTLTAAAVVFFIFALEGIREGSSGPVIFPALFGALGQLLGLGAVSLALFVPSFIFSTAFASKVKSNRIPALGYSIVLILTLALTAGMVVMVQLPPTSKAFVNFNIVFQFAPLIYVVTTIFRFLFKSPYADEGSIRYGFGLLGGISMAIYYISLTQVLLKAGIFSPPEDIKTVEDFFKYIPSTWDNLDFTAPAAQFLLFDLAAIFLAPVLAVFYEGKLGLGKILLLIFDSVFLSPGTALTNLFAAREVEFSKAAKPKQS